MDELVEITESRLTRSLTEEACQKYLRWIVAQLNNTAFVGIFQYEQIVDGLVFVVDSNLTV